MKHIRTAIVTTALFLFAGCASTDSAATGAAAMNAKCPVSGEQLDGDCPTTMVDGKNIGFCCNKCMTKFEGMTPADQKAKVMGSMPMK
ncbi:MAG: hypothetical protein AB7O97_19330 [Planctomycetota bacterium]